MAANDEPSLRTVLAPTLELTAGRAPPELALDSRTSVLVRLGALLALGASTTSLCWAVELASTAGAGDDAIVGALLAGASVAGSAQVVASAPRLALALGFDLELDGWDGS